MTTQSSMYGTTPDYSRASSWFRIPEITRGADTLYIYATEYIRTSFKEGAPDFATLDNEEMLEGVMAEYTLHASAFEKSTNVFVPYYRQSGLAYAEKVRKATGDIAAALAGMPYEDITAALDHYFENLNQGRPFIIAGHSQGSSIILLLLKNYFREHPEYYARMIAAYAIGISVTKEYLAANPHVKFACGESDTGVVISWNTEGCRNVEENAFNMVVLPNAVSINPLNWRLDETYASSSLNPGSLVENARTGQTEIADIGADAQVNLRRGVVVTNARPEPMPEEDAKIAISFFGPEGYHDSDYTFFYTNIRDNAAKRVAARLAGR